jgi:NitT/TauT family transport system substrate-binding protein
MVVACREGWKRYLESAGETNAAILEANQHGMTEQALEFGADELRPLCLPDDMSLDEIGKMTPARWQTLIEQFTEMGLIDPRKVTAERVFTTAFLE